MPSTDVSGLPVVALEERAALVVVAADVVAPDLLTRRPWVHVGETARATQDDAPLYVVDPVAIVPAPEEQARVVGTAKVA